MSRPKDILVAQTIDFPLLLVLVHTTAIYRAPVSNVKGIQANRKIQKSSATTIRRPAPKEKKFVPKMDYD